MPSEFSLIGWCNVANVLDDLAVRIATVISGTVGTNVFKSTMPALPDACVTVVETGGLAPTRALGTAGVQYERPGVQILVRGAVADYETRLVDGQRQHQNLQEENHQASLLMISKRYYQKV